MMTKPLKFDVNRVLYPFEHKFLELGNGINMHYVDEGMGRTCSCFMGTPRGHSCTAS